MTGWLITAGAAAAALGATLGLLGALWRLSRPVREFLDDWRGEAPRPGFPGRPGVPERLTAMEGRLARVEAEVTPNHGHSMRDQVRALAQRAGVAGDR